MTDLKEPIYGYQWRCVPGCDFANHELRQRCRNCGTPRSLAAFIDYYRPAVFRVTDLIARLEALEKEATPGPWTHRRGYVLIPIGGGVELIVADCAGGDDRFHWARQMQENGSLIVELRNDLPAILHALKVAKAAEAYVSENPPLFLQLDSEMYYECCHCQSTARSENDVRHRDECPWVALVAAVKGEQK